MKLRAIAMLTSMLLSTIVVFNVAVVLASEPYVVPPGYLIETFACGLDGPFGMVFDSDGDLYVANEGVESQGTYPGTAVSKVTTDGVVSVYANGFEGPSGLAIDPDDNLYVSDDTGRVIKVAPNGEMSIFATDLPNPNVLAFDQSWNLFVATHGDGQIHRITPEGQVSVFAGGFQGPQALAFDGGGRLYTSDHSGRVFIVTPGGMAIEDHTVFAEFPEGYKSTQGGMVFDAEGNLYASSSSGAVFQITADEAISPFVAGFESEGSASQAFPRGLAFDQEDRLYITEFGSGLIWKVTWVGEFKIEFEAEASGTFWMLKGIPGPDTPVPPPLVAVGDGVCKADGDATVTQVASNVYGDFPADMKMDGEVKGEIRLAEFVDGELVVSEETWRMELEFWNLEDAGGVFWPDDDVFAVLYEPPPEGDLGLCIGYKLELERLDGEDDIELKLSGEGYGIVAGVMEAPGLAVGFVVLVDIEGSPYWLVFAEEIGSDVGVEVEVDL